MYGFEDMSFQRLREPEVPGVQLAASQRLLGQTNEAMCEAVNAAGYRTTRGNRFRPDALAKILDNPAIAGLREDENGKLVETGGPAMISREDFLAIRAMRPSNDPDRQRADQREYLITGPLGVCGLCATPITSSPANSGSRGHRCSPSSAQHPGGCGKVRINADLLETFVAEHVLAELAKPAVSALIEQARDAILAEAEELSESAASAKRRQKKLGEDYARPSGMSLAAFTAADKELAQQARVDAARARFLAQVKRVPIGSVPELVKWWKHAPMAAKRGLLVLMLEKIEVFPAPSRGSRTVDSSRVTLHWRDWTRRVQ